MALEIEKKFLVTGDEYKKNGPKTFFLQGFLNTDKERVVRVRIAGDKGLLTIKGKGHGLARVEYEYEIPVEEAQAMLNELCVKPIITKNRYIVEYKGHTWEVDEFLKDNSGLVIAEIELGDQNESFTPPPWVGEEVTNNPKYYNANLVHNPYKIWK